MRYNFCFLIAYSDSLNRNWCCIGSIPWPLYLGWIPRKIAISRRNLEGSELFIEPRYSIQLFKLIISIKIVFWKTIIFRQKIAFCWKRIDFKASRPFKLRPLSNERSNLLLSLDGLHVLWKKDLVFWSETIFQKERFFRIFVALSTLMTHMSHWTRIKLSLYDSPKFHNFQPNFNIFHKRSS